jgi:hypothetical protein
VLPASTNETRAVIGLLDDFQRWQGMQADELRRELATASQAYAASAPDTDRVRLALLLSIPNTPFRDDWRAMALLAPVAAPADSTENGPIQKFAELLLRQITERVNDLRDEKKRGDELAQKLEALRAIERSISEREQKVRTK